MSSDSQKIAEFCTMKTNAAVVELADTRALRAREA